MTIKQAAMWLCQPGIVSMIHDPTTKKALSVAVKALAESEHGTNLAEVSKDCISREQAIEIVKKYFEKIGLNGDICVDGLRQLPSIQPEIVRCKDCKYARLTDDGSCKYCDIWFPDEAEYMDGDYYCASAERKSNG